MRILVTGASGLLGRAIMREAQKQGHDVRGVAFSRAEGSIARVDLTDSAAVEALVADVQPEALIHTAAERRPDVVDRDPGAVQKLNVEVPRVLARACGALPKPAYLVNVSTDYVFDGQRPPFHVGDQPRPLNKYGESKAAAERAVLDAAREGLATNVRVPVLYGETLYDGESAVNVLLGAIQPPADAGAGKKVMDAHAVRYPTNVTDVARALLQLCTLQPERQTMPPTVHFSAEEAMTKYDMCKLFSRLYNEAAGREVTSVAHLEPEYEIDPQAATQRPENCKLDLSESKALGLNLDCVGFEAWWTEYLKKRVANEKGGQSAGGPHRPAGGAADAAAGAAGGPPRAPSSASGADTAHAPQGAAPGGAQDQQPNTEQPNSEQPVHAAAAAVGAQPARGESSAQGAAKPAPLARPPPSPASQATSEDPYGEPSPVKPGPSARPPTPPPSFSIRVGEPHRVGDAMNAHVVYTLRVTTNAPWMRAREISVLRRYSDFRWLHAALVSNHPGVFVPAMPEKVKIGRFAPELVEFRRRTLEVAINKIAQHPELRRDEDLRVFLESTNLPADMLRRNEVRGPIETPEHKTYFGWSHSLQAPRFHESDAWFPQQSSYVTHLEQQLHELVAAVTALAQRRREHGAAIEELAQALTALSGSALSRSVSTCFAALAETKRRAAESAARLADHEAHILGVVLYEYERMCGSVRKAFAARLDVWRDWQRAEEDVRKQRAAAERQRSAHYDSQAHQASAAALRAAQLHTRFDEVTRLCHAEMDRFERDKVADVRQALDHYMSAYEEAEAELVRDVEHCTEILRRQSPQPPAPQQGTC